MRRYLVTAGMTVPSGTVMFPTPEQAADRAHVLEQRDDGTCVTVSATCFKAGERIVLDEDVDLGRATMAKLQPLDEYVELYMTKEDADAILRNTKAGGKKAGGKKAVLAPAADDPAAGDAAADAAAGG